MTTDYLRQLDDELSRWKAEQAARNEPIPSGYVFSDEEAAGALPPSLPSPTPSNPFPRAQAPDFNTTDRLQRIAGMYRPTAAYAHGFDPTAEDLAASASVDEMMAAESMPQASAQQRPSVARVPREQPDMANLDMRKLPSFGAGQDAEKSALVALERNANLDAGDVYGGQDQDMQEPGGFLPETDFDRDINVGLAERKKFEAPSELREGERVAATREVESRRAIANARYQNTTGAQREAVVEWINRPMAQLEAERARYAGLATEGQQRTVAKASQSIGSDATRRAQDQYIERARAVGLEIDETRIRSMTADQIESDAGALQRILARAEDAADTAATYGAREGATWEGMPSNQAELAAWRERQGGAAPTEGGSTGRGRGRGRGASAGVEGGPIYGYRPRPGAPTYRATEAERIGERLTALDRTTALAGQMQRLSAELTAADVAQANIPGAPVITPTMARALAVYNELQTSVRLARDMGTPQEGELRRLEAQMPSPDSVAVLSAGGNLYAEVSRIARENHRAYMEAKGFERVPTGEGQERPPSAGAGADQSSPGARYTDDQLIAARDHALRTRGEVPEPLLRELESRGIR